jgi:HlyD family secretion protein
MTNRRWSAKVPLTIGVLSAVVLIGGAGVWGVKTEIAGAVVASGVIEVENDSQVIQHPDGGVVAQIFARDGDKVQAGDVLIELDGTFLRSELSVIEGQLVEVLARKSRLRAERDDQASLAIVIEPEFTVVDEATIAEQVQGQVALFNARSNSLVREREQLAEQQRQIVQQISGMNAQLESVARQLTLIQEELGDVETLFERGLVQASRLLELQRAEAELQGQVGRLDAQVAEARTRISTLEIEALRLSDTRREEAIAQLRDLSVNESQLRERRTALSEQLGRLAIVAPVSGTVFGSRIFAVRSVVKPAEAVLYLVPGDQPLRVAAKIDPLDVDQVYAGQEVALVFSSFSRRTTPEARGHVQFVSADAARDDISGRSYYEAIVELDDASRGELGDLELIPGMPVETFIKTDERTPLSYLVQPMTTYFSRAFREE